MSIVELEVAIIELVSSIIDISWELHRSIIEQTFSRIAKVGANTMLCLSLAYWKFVLTS